MGQFVRVIPAGGALVALLLLTAAAASAQAVEITPFAGYRFGGSFSTVPAGAVVDDDGGTSFGAVVDVVFGSQADGLKVEGVFSHQVANLQVRTGTFDPLTRVSGVVDQFLIGGIQDLSDGRARPFLAGLLGLTRYAVPGDSEVRFAVGVGAGVKLYATRTIGVRLDARGYMTITDLSGAGVCGGYGCAIGFSVNPTFQGDLTAGLLIAF